MALRGFFFLISPSFLKKSFNLIEEESAGGQTTDVQEVEQSEQKMFKQLANRSVPTPFISVHRQPGDRKEEDRGSGGSSSNRKPNMENLNTD